MRTATSSSTRSIASPMGRLGTQATPFRICVRQAPVYLTPAIFAAHASSFGNSTSAGSDSTLMTIRSIPASR